MWNVLAEEKGEPYRAKEVLEANTDYTIRIDLAAVKYAPGKPSVATKEPGEIFRDVLKELAKRTNKKTEEFTAIVIVDETVFEPLPKLEIPFTLNLERLRAFLDGKLALPPDPLAVLQESRDGDANFRLAPIQIDLRTQPMLPAEPGSIAVSIWHNRMPVDEISFDLCTAKSNCKGVKLESSGLDGIDSARTALECKSALPVAAIHLLQFKTGVVGVFRDHTVPDARPVSWYQNTSPADISKSLDDITSNLGGASAGDLMIQGIGLFNTIFPPANEEATKAGKIFAEFVRREAARQLKRTAANMPSLFVRAHFSDKTPPSLLPLAMAAVRMSDTAIEFVGQHFRIESPLRLQSYGGSDQCISNWHVVGPPEDNEDAFIKANTVLEKQSRISVASGRALNIGGKHFPITGNMLDFFKWGLSGEIEQPTVLSILSHHDRNHIRFTKEPLPAKSLRRAFGKHPTIAILNGCNTVSFSAGSTGFIAALNDLGVRAVVATITEVTGGMAGDFLDCFAREVESAPPQGKLLSEAFSGALICLADTKKYGAKANWYALLGDGGLRLCRP